MEFNDWYNQAQQPERPAKRLPAPGNPEIMPIVQAILSQYMGDMGPQSIPGAAQPIGFTHGSVGGTPIGGAAPEFNGSIPGATGGLRGSQAPRGGLSSTGGGAGGPYRGPIKILPKPEMYVKKPEYDPELESIIASMGGNKIL